ncbi:PPE family protein [Mycolicibacterium madagascariense]|uniref:PPE family protein n=2 Tax=Mycolicibacterium madagascariense TaxID=212765 RepID=A0A7I7XPG0_9MYCO|nr:PPE family protein [Mycolicibacterium madagascariense]BBZ31075.1 PPE family protein [Mycolicibacterium madagascariense]
MFYGALPPEVNTGRLMAGAGVGPMYQAAAGWEALALSLETQADELAANLVALQATWQGAGSDRAVQATTPMVMWLRTAALQAQKRAVQAMAQAAAYAAALAATPPLPEIEGNHVTHATLEATNFLGVNTAPIAVNETDYFVRMWNQAADAMAGYQAATSANTVFEPIPPMTPIVVPGVGESTAAAAAARNAALMPGSLLRETAFAHVSAEGAGRSAALESGELVSAANMAGQRAGGRAQEDGRDAGRPDQLVQQGAQLAGQVASQLGAMVGQLPQQVMQPVQQLTQPLQQVMQIFGQLGSGFGSDETQLGLVGASPVSNHPLAGGSGAAAGAGLVRAASLPGLCGTSTRTPLMAGLLGEQATTTAPSAAAGVGGAGLAPVGGSGVGPSGATGERARGAGSRPGLRAPTPLPAEDDEEDDW